MARVGDNVLRHIHLEIDTSARLHGLTSTDTDLKKRVVLGYKRWIHMLWIVIGCKKWIHIL
jgi:hypothetical protein